MSEFRKWEELSEIEQLECTFSDAYKDARGFRPRMEMPVENRKEWLIDQIDCLSREITLMEEEERLMQAEAINRFEARVALTMATGAADRETAIRWILEAEDDVYMVNDPDHFCYCNGLPYGYLGASV